MPTPIPPVDFRYVKLSPGPSSVDLVVSAGAAVSVSAAIVGYAGLSLAGIAASLVAGSLTAMIFGRRAGPLLARLGHAPTSMAIVPWGVLIDPDEEESAARVLHWSAVRRVNVDSVHSRDAHGTPVTQWSVVTVETERERFVGRTTGAVGLERLQAHVKGYADQSSRPLAQDLEGHLPASQAVHEPVIRSLIERAKRIIETVEGIEALSLISEDFRGSSAHEATPATLTTLSKILASPSPHAADPRALAALVSAELDERGCVQQLLRLATDVHPLVALCARAAALRLGEGPMRSGALAEVGPFVNPDDLDAAEQWAGERNEQKSEPDDA